MCVMIHILYYLYTSFTKYFSSILNFNHYFRLVNKLGKIIIIIFRKKNIYKHKVHDHIDIIICIFVTTIEP